MSRVKIAVTFFLLLVLLILARLSFWQVIKAQELQTAAHNQYTHRLQSEGRRGNILWRDGSLLVANQQKFHLFAEPNITRSQNINQLSQELATIIATEASASEQQNIESELETKLGSDRSWIRLAKNLNLQQQQQIESLEIPGLGFDHTWQRAYPEASSAAHVVGFLGHDQEGVATGYFGIEGQFNDELSAQSKIGLATADGRGQLLSWLSGNANQLNGRDVTTTLNRKIQLLAEKTLQEAVIKYQALGGEIVIVDPKSGEILALAANPSYFPAEFGQADSEIFINPSAAAIYEPGSTFKILTVASGLDLGVIQPDTKCQSCDGPRQMGKFTIRTWNDEYNQGQTMTEALARSDNIAMIEIAEKIGINNFQTYLQAFGISQPLALELQEAQAAPWPQKWGPVELATRSFGQGISTTSIELTQAINAVANDGKLVPLHIVSSISDPVTGRSFKPQLSEPYQVISGKSAELTTQMMVYAASQGEAKWVARDTYQVAAKTGTSQIPDPAGGYKDTGTITSFVGFAPADNPRFTMLVKLNEPQSSPWAAETAAPTWYQLADQLLLLLTE